MMAAQDQMDGGEAAQRLEDAHRQLLGDNSIQFQLPPAGANAGQPLSPDAGPSSAPPPVSHTVPPDPSAAPPAPSGISASSGGGVEGLMHVFLWLAAAVALLIILYWVFAFFQDRQGGNREARPKKQRTRQEETWRPEEAQAAQLLDEADLLAGQGRYDEAARLLLHRSIGEIHAHRPDLVRPALTSRDIAGHPLLPRGPATAFARIAALVERSLFARRPLGADDWADCRAAYRDFAFADGWRG